MPDPSGTTGAAVATAGSTLTIPADTAGKFPELIQMIQQSRSMNDEERQYWVDALSIMSEDQVKNLYSILDNERNQLKAAEEAYRNSTQGKKPAAAAFDSQAYLEKKRARVEAERQAEHEELNHEDALLAELEKL